MVTEKIVLPGVGGQGYDAVIMKREDGSVFVQLQASGPGYGDPYLELNELRRLLRRMEELLQKREGEQ